MNEMVTRDGWPLGPHPRVRVTQAAEGLPRYRWTVAQIDELTRLGVFQEQGGFELIGGEIVPMQSKGARHERVKMELNRHFGRSLAVDIDFIPETTFRLSEDTFVEPEFTLFPRSVGVEGLNAQTALLAIEISDTTLRYDLGRKIAIYASFGVREVWVVNVETMVTRVHREPAGQGYGAVTEHGAAETLTPVLVPELSVCLAALGLASWD